MRSLRNVLTLMLALTPMAYSQAETEASLSAAYYASEQFMFKYTALGTSEVSHHVTYQCIYDIVPGTETPLFDGAMPLHPEERPKSIEETYLKAIQLKVVLDADFSAADESVRASGDADITAFIQDCLAKEGLTDREFPIEIRLPKITASSKDFR